MSNGQRSRWSSALPSAFGNSASVCRWRRVRGIVYRVQWFGSYRSGRLSDMPDRPSIRKDIHVPVLAPAVSDAIYDASSLGRPRMFLLGLQHLFAMFGATVLVPVLTGLSVSATLLFAGLGTLLFHFLSRGKVPAFLAHRLPLLPVMPQSRPTARPSFCPTPAWA